MTRGSSMNDGDVRTINEIMIQQQHHDVINLKVDARNKCDLSIHHRHAIGCVNTLSSNSKQNEDSCNRRPLKILNRIIKSSSSSSLTFLPFTSSWNKVVCKLLICTLFFYYNCCTTNVYVKAWSSLLLPTTMKSKTTTIQTMALCDTNNACRNDNYLSYIMRRRISLIHKMSKIVDHDELGEKKILNDNINNNIDLLPNNSIELTNKRPKYGDIVTIDCMFQPSEKLASLKLFDGIVDYSTTTMSNDDQLSLMTRLQFIVGNGNYIPSLHEYICTMDIDTVVKDIELDAGYGPIQSNLIIKIEYEQIGNSINREQIKIGTELVFGTAPQQMQCRVIDYENDTTFTIDANHLYSGQSYQSIIHLLSCESGPIQYENNDNDNNSIIDTAIIFNDHQSSYDIATFALGCFWGGELEYMRINGVVGTMVGYTQGNIINPSYEEVCSGTTGHTEAISVIYDSKKLHIMN